MNSLETLTEAIIKGRRKEAVPLTQEAIDKKADPDSILQALIQGMDEVGRRFKANEYFVPEVLISARAMKECMELLEPVLVEAGLAPEYTAIIGTVEGDLHDIGKNLVGMMWKGANFKVIDLGTNISAAQFAEAAKEHNADVVGLSALLTTTMGSMEATVAAIRETCPEKTKVLIGGAPITQAFAEKIGADGYAPDAGSAVEKARSLVGAA